jgi:hypothetical protein
MAGTGWRGAIAVAGSLSALLTACAPPPPAELSPQFRPDHDSWPPGGKVASGGAAASCHIYLADVRDLRSDPQSMGHFGGLQFRESDPAGWVRSGLQSLARDSRIALADNAAQSNLVLNVELLKAYATNVTGETHSVSVVVRVHYGRGSTPLDDQIYRGTENGLVWLNPRAETQSSVDDALSQVIDGIDQDIITRCGAQSAK